MKQDDINLMKFNEGTSQRWNKPKHHYSLWTNCLESSSVVSNLGIQFKKVKRMLICISKGQLVHRSGFPLYSALVKPLLKYVQFEWLAIHWNRLSKETGEICILQYNKNLTGQDPPASDLALKLALL